MVLILNINIQKVSYVTENRLKTNLTV